MAERDLVLGKKVQGHLIAQGCETPIVDIDPVAYLEMEKSLRSVLQGLGMDTTDDSIRDTPARITKMYKNEIFYGLDYANFPKCSTFDNKMGYDEMVLEKGIDVKSFCEHHFLPFVGECALAYIPKNRVLGLSKFNRVVDFFSRRPQVQERLTEQVFQAMKFILDTDDVIVVIKAKHFCVHMRGAENTNCDTVTSKIGGRFRDGPVRNEFFQLAGI